MAAACHRLSARAWQPCKLATVATAAATAPGRTRSHIAQSQVSSKPQRLSTATISAKKGSDSKKTKAPKKGDLPTKVCVSCGRPFTWRKKWEKVWDEVKYCSDRCRSTRPSGTSESTTPTAG